MLYLYPDLHRLGCTGALALWYYARYRDRGGSGQVRIKIDELRKFFGRHRETIKRWVREGLRAGIFRCARSFRGVYWLRYAGLKQLAAQAGLANLTCFKVKVKDLKRLRTLTINCFVYRGQNQSHYLARRAIRGRKVPFVRPQQIGQGVGAGDRCYPTNSPHIKVKYVQPDYFLKEIAGLKVVRHVEQLNGSRTAKLYEDDSLILFSEKHLRYGISQERVGRLMGLSRKTINKHLNLKTNPVIKKRTGVVGRAINDSFLDGIRSLAIETQQSPSPQLLREKLPLYRRKRIKTIFYVYRERPNSDIFSFRYKATVLKEEDLDYLVRLSTNLYNFKEIGFKFRACMNRWYRRWLRLSYEPKKTRGGVDM